MEEFKENEQPQELTTPIKKEITALKLKKKTAKTSLITMALLAGGIIMCIPAFSNVIRMVPRTTFCFKPPVTYKVVNELLWDAKAKKRYVKSTKTPVEQASDKRYCQGDKIRTGLASTVQDERENNQQFSGKISILKQIPATYGWYSYLALGGSVLCLTAWFIYADHTNELIDQLNILYNYDRYRVMLEDANASIDLLAIAKDTQVTQDAMSARFDGDSQVVQDVIRRDVQKKLQSNLTADEITMMQNNASIHNLLTEKEVALQVAKLEQEIMKQRAIKAKHEKNLKNNSETHVSNNDVSNDEESVRKALMASLKKPQNRWILDAVETVNTVLIHGRAGSGKSTLGCALILLHIFLNGAKLELLADFDLEANIIEGKAWEHLLEYKPKMYGARDNSEEYSEAIQHLKDFCNHEDRTEKSDQVLFVFDEVSRLKALVDPEIASKFIPFVCTKPRKKRVKVFIFNHGLTNEQLGGVEGYQKTVKEECLVIHPKSNGKTPMMRGTISNIYDSEGNRCDDVRIDIPAWLNPSKLKEIFAGNLDLLKDDDEIEEELEEYEIDTDDLEADLWKSTGGSKK